MPKDFFKEKITLEEWFNTWPKNKGCSEEVRNFLTAPVNKKIFEITLKLQGQIRGIGKHAGGVVITQGKCWEDIPVNVTKGAGESEVSIVTAFQEADKSGKDLSPLGILKLDRLNLSTLNIIKDTIKLVKDKKSIDIKDQVDYVDLNNPKLYEELQLGLNHGVFQFESPGMTTLIKKMKTDTFEELVACNALYRPGPMNIGAHYEYANNKFDPEGIEYPHESFKSILEETNGVLVFQEQLMFAASKIGAMNLGEGDMLRRAMDKASKIIDKEVRGEKLEEEEKNNKSYKSFLLYWNQFLDGAEKKNGYKKEEIDKIKGYLIKYLGYSFNKCLTENHKIISEERGEIDLLDVKEGEKVLSYNTKTKKNEYNRVKKVHHNGKKKVYKIKTSSGKVLECTLDHKIMTEEGMKTLKEIIDKKLKIKIQ